MRIALVDDNPIDRMNLRTLLQADPRVEFVGEAESLTSGLGILETLKPEVLFLDIELGCENGFRLLDSPWRAPCIVFTTLHQHYAVKAFEVQATDFLVKPIVPARLTRALNRVERELDTEQEAKAPEMLATGDLLVFKLGTERRVLTVERIAWISGDRDYTRVVAFDGKEYLDNRRMRDWQQILPAKLFRVLDRSTIVNINEVAAYRPTINGGQVTMRNATAGMLIGHAAFKRLEECLDRSRSETK